MGPPQVRRSPASRKQPGEPAAPASEPSSKSRAQAGAPARMGPPGAPISQRLARERATPPPPPPPPAAGAPATRRPLLALLCWLLVGASAASAASQLSFDRDSGAYSGLTFTFDPRLDRRVEWLHFEHWLAVMQQTSEILHEALSGRAHLAEIRVLIPYKWRQSEWPVLHKPGSPIMSNRRLAWADSDVIVGLEDPVYKETPFAVQHDECGQPGLHIRMPVAFLEQAGEARLRGRQLAREFAALRYGLFKESGFRADPMYPPFASLAGLEPGQQQRAAGQLGAPAALEPAANRSGAGRPAAPLRGFDARWRPCAFETSPGSGLPAGPQAAQCLPYLVAAPGEPADPGAASFNLMSADPFSHAELAAARAWPAGERPLDWRDLAARAKWHLCGDPAPLAGPGAAARGPFEHNQRASNKQNKMCHERSALDVIRAGADFRRAQPRFLQEMPPRLIMCFEYTSHLYQTHRLDHAFIEAIINKFLAFDLIADTELATVVFGQHSSRLEHFQRLEASLSSRFTLFNPAVDPFDEPLAHYSGPELAQLAQLEQLANNLQAAPARLIKGTCSLARMLAEVNSLLQRASHYDDLGADLVVITSGLFVEDEARIEELIRASNFRLEHNRLHLIVYPSTMLFDTKPRDGLGPLDSQLAEAVVQQRINKLLAIQRLTGGHIHLVKEHLDAQGDIKPATITQFYQIFDKISKGHSWDQSHSMQLLDSRPVQPSPNGLHPNASADGPLVVAPAPGSSRLVYQFQVDSSLTHELLVGLIEPRSPHSNALRAGRRFSLKNLQLRSPGGHMIFTETQTWSSASAAAFQPNNSSQPAQDLVPNPSAPLESAFFPYRAQLSLAAFHVKAHHLQALNSTGRLAGLWTLSATTEEPIQTSAVAMARVSPTGDTLTANCWIQAYHQSAAGAGPDQPGAGEGPLKSVKVFVQVRGGQRHQVVPSAGLLARLEVQDQLGNIVQNVNMLDDGLGTPDMTQADGIWSQLVQRAHRPGFYRVSVELSSARDQFAGPSSGGHQHQSMGQQQQASPANQGPNSQQPAAQDPAGEPAEAGLGQDNICCGSFMPVPETGAQVMDTRHVSRQLYCGTFYVDERNKLAEQRPPRVNNLTIVSVDQDNRRVTLRWFEPQALDVSMMLNSQPAPYHLQAAGSGPTRHSQLAHSNELLDHEASDLGADEASASSSSSSSSSSDNMESAAGADQHLSRPRSRRQHQTGPAPSGSRQASDEAAQEAIREARGFIMGSGGRLPVQVSTGAGLQHESVAQTLMGRYEIKMFTDREMIKRAFEAKQEVGFRFSEWNVEGSLPNATTYGGMKEITLRVPPIGREGVYYIAMKVYNNLGLASQMSNIIQFYLRHPLAAGDSGNPQHGANFTLLDGLLLADLGPSATIDAEGNIYDRNTGELIQRATYGPSGSGPASFSLINYSLDSLSVLILFSLLAFIMSVVCVTLVACLASSVRKSAPTKRVAGSMGAGERGPSKARANLVDDDDDNASDKKMASSGSMMTGACSGSSMVSASEVGSSASSGHDVDINKLAALGDELTYSSLQQQQRDQQHQAQLIQSQHMMSMADEYQQQQQQQQHMNYFGQQQQQQQVQLQPATTGHTIVNGYTYATVANAFGANKHRLVGGDLNQNGLEPLPGDELLACQPAAGSAWPADILMSHYDKVKQARERNEAPPVMRVETLEQQGAQADGLPSSGCDDDATAAIVSSASYLVRAGNVQARNNYLNQQLQQQLSTVLRSKQHQRHTLDSSPALEGVTGEFACDQYDSAPPTGANSLAAYGTTTSLPPPPQYIYCSPGTATQAATATSTTNEPSIYSQVTNLQQVISQPILNENNYYANYYDHEQQQHHHQYHHQQQQQQLNGDEFDKSNSAISEV